MERTRRAFWNHDRLGHHRLAHRRGHNTLPVLRRALSPRSGGGGLFPRRNYLSDALVPEPRPRPGARLVLDRHARGPDHQPQDFQCPRADWFLADDRRRTRSTPRAAWTQRLAMALHLLGYSRHRPWPARLARVDGPTLRRRLAF